MSVFETLKDINVNDKTEKKGNLTYLSWAWAWAEVKKAFPDAYYTIYENADGWNYHTDGRTCWVKTGVTIDGLEHVEYLPVMDFKNKSIPVNDVTSFEVNKAIQRSLTKACARHGLGLYIYAGEDLPEQEAEIEKEAKKEANKSGKTFAPAPTKEEPKETKEEPKYHKANEPITVDQLTAIGALQDTPERVEYYKKALKYWNTTPEKLTYSQGIEIIRKLRGLT